MKAIVCELCAGNQMKKENGVYVCQNCGTQYSIEEAKKLMVEIEGKVDVSGSTVKVDKRQEFENYLKIARTAKATKDYEKASRYYDKAYEIDPDNWEAAFYPAYLDSVFFMDEKVIYNMQKLQGNNRNVLNIIKNTLAKSSEIEAALKEMKVALELLAGNLYLSLYDQYDSKINKRPVDRADKERQERDMKEFFKRGSEIFNVLFYFGDDVEKHWREKFVNSISVSVWKKAIEGSNKITRCAIIPTEHARIIDKYTSKVSKYDSSYEDEIYDSDSNTQSRIYAIMIFVSVIIVVLAVILIFNG